MKKYLLSNSEKLYKANLHCHTTYSDGELTPEETKELYKSLGYSIVAFTDHDLFVEHNDLTDDDFLALNGFEMEFFENANGREFFELKNCHLCFIALDKDQNVQPCWHRSKYLLANAVNYKDMVVFDENEKDFEREYSAKCINEAISIGRKKGFFVTYNHPTWSLESYPEYSEYTGMNALEMFNGDGLTLGYEEYNTRVYSDLLNQGKKIFTVAGDDNHNTKPKNSRRWDSGIAFTVINAKSLSYKDVTDAMLSGKVYASEKPLIYNLYYEDGDAFLNFHIDFSSADRVLFTTDVRSKGVEFKEGGKELTSADFKVNKKCKWVRFTVIDESGKVACTSAYFLNDLKIN